MRGSHQHEPVVRRYYVIERTLARALARALVEKIAVGAPRFQGCFHRRSGDRLSKKPSEVWKVFSF
jgi:hypothetical protein